MKKRILFIVCIFLLSSCGADGMSSKYFEDKYDKQSQTLDLSDQDLVELPDFSAYIKWEWLDEIETIDLSDNDIASIPSWTFDLFSSLDALNLDSNNFKTGSDVIIPKTIRKLSLNDNELDDIEWFSTYTKLIQLHLNNNNLEDNDLWQLWGFKKLAELRVEWNNISEDLLQKINEINNK